MSALLRIVGRWLIWPFIIVFALNVENYADSSGYSKLLPDAFKFLEATFFWVQSVATTKWVFYPALFFSGMFTYEWLWYFSERMEEKSSAYKKWLARNLASQMRWAYAKNGMFRKVLDNPENFKTLNRRLLEIEMPKVPERFSSDEAINKDFAEYMHFIERKKLDMGKKFHSAIIMKIERY